MTVTSHSGNIADRRRWAGVPAALLAVVLAGLPMAAAAQSVERSAGGADVAGAVTPPDYVIGPGDVLAVRFWRQDEVSADVVVRPDGKISLLLMDDIDAAGLRPEELRDRITAAAGKFFEEPRVTVVVKEINSRNVFITGMVAKPGPYPLHGSLRVVQLIALAGGLLEFAKDSDIVIMRNEQGKQTGYRFNYQDLSRLRDGRLDQNIELKPGDTVIVP